MLSWDQVTRLLIKSLSDEERETSVIYLDQRIFEEDTAIEIAGVESQLSKATMIAFVDLDPMANWGHACRYVLVDPEGGDLVSADAQFPPFMRDYPPTLRVIWVGENVPDWAVDHGPPE
jgi:hypothetical protein